MRFAMEETLIDICTLDWRETRKMCIVWTMCDILYSEWNFKKSYLRSHIDKKPFKCESGGLWIPQSEHLKSNLHSFRC